MTYVPPIVMMSEPTPLLASIHERQSAILRLPPQCPPTCTSLFAFGSLPKPVIESPLSAKIFGEETYALSRPISEDDPENLIDTGAGIP